MRSYSHEMQHRLHNKPHARLPACQHHQVQWSCPRAQRRRQLAVRAHGAPPPDYSQSRRHLLAGMLTLGGTAAVPGPSHAEVFCGVVDRSPSWAVSTPWQEDLTAYAGTQTWYRFVNPPAKGNPLTSLFSRPDPVAAARLPLLVIGGGPGLPCAYLNSMELLAATQRPIIFYDQVGVGISRAASGGTCPPPNQLTLDLFRGQIEALVTALQLPAVHLYGQGTWGSLLAMEVAARHRGTDGIDSANTSTTTTASSSSNSFRVASAVCSSPAATYAAAVQDRIAGAKALGGAAAQALLDPASVTSAERQAAEQQYKQQYTCRGKLTGLSRAPAGAPECVRAAWQKASQEVALALEGSSRFSVEGSPLAGWSVGPLVQQLQGLPMVLLRGDAADTSAATVQQLQQQLGASAEVVTLADAGDFVHIDAWEQHLILLENFMSRVEGLPSPVTGDGTAQ